MIPKPILDLIKLVLPIIAGFIFTVIVGKYPTFPVPREIFISFLVWLVLSVLGAGLVTNYVVNKLTKEK